MAVYKLQLEEFNTAEYELIAIHTTIEVSKLAFLLNQKLNTRFQYIHPIDKTEKKEKGCFERYFFEDEKNEILWNLLENKSIIKNGNNQDFLFEQIDQTMYLIPEYKKVDYILKIDADEDFFDMDAILTAISSINTISTSYKMEKNKIKTTSNLIF